MNKFAILISLAAVSSAASAESLTYQGVLYEISNGVARAIALNGASGDLVIPEFVTVGDTECPVFYVYDIFRNNRTLRTVTIPDCASFSGTFSGCTLLEKAWWNGPCQPMMFLDCPKLSMDLTWWKEGREISRQCFRMQNMTISSTLYIPSWIVEAADDSFSGRTFFHIETHGVLPMVSAGPAEQVNIYRESDSTGSNIEKFWQNFWGSSSLLSVSSEGYPVELQDCPSLTWLSCKSGSVSLADTPLLRSLSFSNLYGDFCAYGLPVEQLDLPYANLKNVDVSGCPALTSLTTTASGSISASENPVLTRVSAPKASAFAKAGFTDCPSLSVVEFGSNCTDFADAAFLGCSSLVSLTNISDSPSVPVTIGERTFSGCTALAHIDDIIAGGVASIGEGAFEQTAWYESQPDGPVEFNNGEILYKIKGNLTEHTELTLENTRYIVGSACRGLSDLTSVIFPDCLQYIGPHAFDGCTSLNSDITIPPSCTFIGIDAFRSTAAEKVHIADGPLSLSIYTVFPCATMIYIGRELTSDSYYTQFGTPLTSLTFGPDITRVDEASLPRYSGGTPSLQYIYSLGTTPPLCSSASIFKGVDTKTVQLVVPDTSIELYKKSYGWSQFANIPGINSITSASNMPVDSTSTYYDLCGRPVSAGTQGVIIIRHSDGHIEKRVNN